jgi:predicted ABC-type ATPase
MSLPEFVITYGPPGCGKSTMTNLSYSNYVQINVDNIISKMDEFIFQAKTITTMIKENINKQEIEKRANYIYQSFRDEADRQSEILLNDSIKNRRNIVFETTGGSKRSISYLEKIIPEISDKNYRIKIIFLHAPIYIIKDRVYIRVSNIGRLPSEEFLEDAYKYACDNFKIIAEMCDEIIITDSTIMPSRNIYHRCNDFINIYDIASISKLPISLLQYIS